MMDKEKGIQRSLITKTWKRCKSLSLGCMRGSSRSGGGCSSFGGSLTKKSLSWHGSSSEKDEGSQQTNEKQQVVPEGCFSVYVGPQKQKFVVKTGYVNHPLFVMLLEEAEAEYGYNSEGPIWLPCNVLVFYEVLMVMDSDDKIAGRKHSCGLISKNGYHILSRSRMISFSMTQF